MVWYLLSVVVKCKVGVAGNYTKCLCDICSFNGIGFIIVPIYILKCELTDDRCVTSNHYVCKLCYCALIRTIWIYIFYKDAFAIEVSVFRSFFLDEIHFSRLKVFRMDKFESSYWGHDRDRVPSFESSTI